MQEKSFPTLQDKTYQTLHQWLTVGRFLPGERLKIRQAAEQATYRMNDADIARMAGLSGRMASAIAEQNSKAYLEASEEFHVTLYRASGSPLLMELIETVWLKVGPISNQLFDDARYSLKLNDAHEDVMAALQQRDGATVRRAIEQDMFYAGQYLKQLCG